MGDGGSVAPPGAWGGRLGWGNTPCLQQLDCRLPSRQLPTAQGQYHARTSHLLRPGFADSRLQGLARSRQHGIGNEKDLRSETAEALRGAGVGGCCS